MSMVEVATLGAVILLPLLAVARITDSRVERKRAMEDAKLRHPSSVNRRAAGLISPAVRGPAQVGVPSAPMLCAVCRRHTSDGWSNDGDGNLLPTCQGCRTRWSV